MNFLILVPLLLLLINAFIAYFFKDKKRNVTLLILSCFVLLSCLCLCFIDDLTIRILPVTNSLKIIFKSDGFAKILSIAVCVCFLLVEIYSFKYMEDEANIKRFYLFFNLTWLVILTLLYSANLFTLYVSFELISLFSFPLVLHELTLKAILAAKKYLYYSIGGSFLALFGVVILTLVSPDILFTLNGSPLFNQASQRFFLLIGVCCTLLGFGVKAGLFPFHKWLIIAHPEAPSNVSAILSGLVTKAGIICMIRVIYYLVGSDFIENTFVQTTILILSLISILMCSLLALFEKNLKIRLAHSTVSQVAYISASLMFLNPLSLVGAMFHMIAHMLIKTSLFLYSGVLLKRYKTLNVDELKGVGQQMPIATTAYTISSLGLIGVPLTIGFISKWIMADGALSSSQNGFAIAYVVILLISAILTAFYLLPLSIQGFIQPQKMPKKEASFCLNFALVSFAVLILFLGVFHQELVHLMMNWIGG